MAKEQVNFLTKKWYEKLVKELHEIQEVKLPEVIERIVDAKAMGDLSENAEYKAALEDRDLLSAKIAQIEELLADVEILDENKKRGEKVDYGSIVTIQLEDWKQYDITMVGTGEVAVENGLKVSFESPMGIAIRGKKAGEAAKMRIGNSRQEITIVKVK